MLAPAAAAQTPAASGPRVARKTVRSSPARDQALISFLQKRYRIPDAKEIKLGPMTETGMPGIFERSVTVTNERRQTARVAMFLNRDETLAIIGQYLDLNSDPWDRRDLSPLHLEDRPVLGAADAPVTIIEFADFECPFCAHAFGEVETLVNTTYKGKVRLIFKNYPLSAHPWARPAAIAAECARVQNPADFWKFARYFYSNQPSISAANVRQKTDELASKLGLDATIFKACTSGTTAAQYVQQDEADGNAVHLTSTPTFFVNGIEIVGLPEGKVFDYVINSQLESSPRASK
jgi:protein-disulfide isomerase